MTYKLINRSELNGYYKVKNEIYRRDFKINLSKLILPFEIFRDNKDFDKCEKNLCYDEIILKILEEEIKTFMNK